MGSRRYTASFLLFLPVIFGVLDGPTETHAGKVLGLFQFPGHSHFTMFEPLLKELAAQGHQVTVVSHFPQKTPIANYTDISLVGSAPFLSGGFTVQEMLEFDMPRVLRFLWEDIVPMCENALKHPSLENLLASKEQFDVIVLELFGVECYYGVAWKLGAPVIAITSGSRMSWGQKRVGNPEYPDVFPVTYTTYTPKMTFWQRVINTGAWVYSTIKERWTSYAVMDKINLKFLGPDVPPIEDLLYNTSLILLNSHFSLNGPLPAVPAVVEVGGLHIDPKKTTLPKVLSEWLDGADGKGVVYVSFGSLARAEEMPLPQLKAIVKVLGSLPQRVLWKCQGDTVGQRLGHKLPPNILTENWIPQAAVLAHRNIRAFVSHGGLMGTQEAVYWGRPMIVVPLFADQGQNANNLVERGMARILHFNDIGENTFGEALEALLNDPSYTRNARHLSSLFRDRPRPPMQEAVYWTEYVMRHRGAPHLRSAAVHLSWWQHWLLDVIGAIFLALAVILLLLRFVFRLLLRLLFRRPSQTEKKHKRS